MGAEDCFEGEEDGIAALYLCLDICTVRLTVSRSSILDHSGLVGNKMHLINAS